VPLPTTKTDAESEVHTGLVPIDAASLADKELSNEPILLPNTEIIVAPNTGPLVIEMDDAVGALKSNAIVITPTCKPTETKIELERVRPDDDLLNIIEDESQPDASPAELANFAKADASDVENPQPNTDTKTAPLMGKLLQLVQVDTIPMTVGAVYESINNDTPYNEPPTDTASPIAVPLPAVAFPTRDEEDIHIDCSTAVPPNVTLLVAEFRENMLPETVMYTAPDDGTCPLLDKTRGCAKEKA
jgi:hypothetical protein